MSDTVRIRSCASREEADYFKGLLESNGVHAMVSVDDYAGLPLPTSDGVELMVLEEDAERADAILKEAQADG